MSQVASDYGQDGQILQMFALVASSMNMVNEALARIPFEAGDSPFVIVDYGTATGLVSTGLIKHCIEWVKTRFGDDQAVCIIYEDQLGNDFNKLFDNVLGKTGFVHNYKSVSVLASATGFYSPCVPKKFVHLGFSSLAMHNLSKKPCILKDTLLYILSEDVNEKEAYEEQAAKDWERSLLCRAEELVPGGQFVASIPGVVDDCYPYCQPATHAKALVERLSHFWRLLRNNGTITQEEYQRANFSWQFGTEDFFKAPVSKADSMVSRAGMRLVGIESANTESPSSDFWVAQNNEDEITAREKYGKRFCGLARQFTQEFFREAFSDERSEEEKDAALQELYATLAKDVALSPAEYTTVLPHYVLHFEKEQ